MDKNNFEKQVQQKMHELKMQPSDAAWKNIEERIKERRPSRRWLLLLLLFAGLGGGGYWVWNNFNRNNSKHISVKNIARQENSDTVHQNHNNTSPAKTDMQEQATTGARNNNAINYHTTSKNAEGFTATNKIAEPPVSARKHIYHLIRNKFSSHQFVSIRNGEISTDVANDEMEQKVFRNPVAQGLLKSISMTNSYDEVDILSKKGIDTKLQKPTPDVNQLLQGALKSQPGNVRKWHFGIMLAPGISGVENRFLAFDNRYYSTATPQGNSAGGSVNINPQPPKSGFGFAGGIYAERKIGKRWSFQTGVNFFLISLTNEIRLDSLGVPNALYSNLTGYNVGYTKNNNDHFDFISLPVSMKFRLNKNRSVPVFLQGGAELSQLLHANALQLNYSNGYYYHDNSLFGKTQIGINAGAAIELFAKKKMSLLIGPHISYYLSPVAHSGLYNNTHFTFAGLNVSVPFKK